VRLVGELLREVVLDPGDPMLTRLPTLESAIFTLRARATPCSAEWKHAA
jgi:hypothetical protein